MSHSMPLDIRCVQYDDPVQAHALVELLDAYARDPMGGSEPRSIHARTHLVTELARRPQAFSVMAWMYQADVEHAVGLVNCFEGFSTFTCKPLVNVHDVCVLASHRGHGVAQRMLALVEEIARERGACKLTLEVLSGNHGAVRLYQRVGFADYALDPQAGTARFMQKWLE
ncbi:MAG TPA: GNAT family N-acetyltransferase [Burkholderiaceae bacterium]